MQYWINHDGVQAGPVDVEELKHMGLTSRAYVWHEGLADWVNITAVPELAGLYEVAEQPLAQQQSDAQAIQPQQAAESSQQAQQPIASEPCPPTNFVWAILSTICCCPPLGIVGIIYASKVTKKYAEGDIKGAQKASETGAWWIIAAIVIGLMTMPFFLMMSSAGV